MRKSFLAIAAVSFLCLTSCNSKSLTFEEANSLVEHIKTSITAEGFNFPTKINITLLKKSKDTYINKSKIRFSLEDKYIYYALKDDNKIDEYWTFAEKKENKIYYLHSINIGKSKTFKSGRYEEYNNDSSLFEETFTILKNNIISEYDAIENVFSESEKIAHTNEQNNHLFSSDYKDLDVDIQCEDKTRKIVANFTIANSLVYRSNILMQKNNEEMQNYEKRFDYNGVNITKPNINDFIKK